MIMLVIMIQPQNAVMVAVTIRVVQARGGVVVRWPLGAPQCGALQLQ